MALQLVRTATTTAPLELDGLLPDRVRELPLADIERLSVLHGNQRARLGDFFRLRGSADDGVIEIEGELSNVHDLGAGMQSGTIRVSGSVGARAGAQMRGGSLVIEGDAGDWLGGEMRGGRIDVRGRAGDSVGAAFPGSPKGMRGGTILVHGDAGREVGHTMRRGLIAIGGACGEMAAVNMLAGSLFVFGACGLRPGAGMRRGTLALLGPTTTLLPTFQRVGVVRPQFMRVALRSLHGHGLTMADAWLDRAYVLHRGDLLTIGRGEIVTPA